MSSLAIFASVAGGGAIFLFWLAVSRWQPPVVDWSTEELGGPQLRYGADYTLGEPVVLDELDEAADEAIALNRKHYTVTEVGDWDAALAAWIKEGGQT